MPGELAQWELGRRQIEDEKTRAYMSALMNILQEKAQGQRFGAQQDMAERQFAEQTRQQNADNERQAARDKMIGDYYKAQMKRWEDEKKANAVPEDKQTPQQKVYANAVDALTKQGKSPEEIYAILSGRAERSSGDGKSSGKTPPDKSAQQRLMGEKMSGEVPFKSPQYSPMPTKLFPGPTNSRPGPRMKILDLGDGKKIRGWEGTDGSLIGEDGKKYIIEKKEAAKK